MMDNDIEKQLSSLAPAAPPSEFKNKVLNLANTAWDEDPIEQQLGKCELAAPDLNLKQSVLAAGNSHWGVSARKTLSPFMRWAIASAAVFAFAFLGGTYDSVMNLEQQGSDYVSRDTERAEQQLHNLFKQTGLDEAPQLALLSLRKINTNQKINYRSVVSYYRNLNDLIKEKYEL